RPALPCGRRRCRRGTSADRTGSATARARSAPPDGSCRGRSARDRKERTGRPPQRGLPVADAGGAPLSEANPAAATSAGDGITRLLAWVRCGAAVGAISHRQDETHMARRTMPAVFLGHGSPMNALERNRFSSAWADFGASIPRPRAILVVSAHWYVN